MSQQPDAGRIADRVQPVAGLKPLIHLYAAAVGRHSDRLESEVTKARSSARCNEQPVPPELTARVEFEDIVSAIAPSSRRACAEMQLDAVAAEHLTECFAEGFCLT